MVYKGIVKERDSKRKMLLLAGCLLMLFLSINMRNFLYICMSAILGVAVFFKKEHIVSEKGVSIKYSLFGMKIDYKWEWSEITGIRPDFKKSKPNVLLEIAKDVTIRGFVFKKEDIPGVLELAKKMNPDMYVDDRTEEERMEAEDERNRKLAEARMRKERARAAEKAKRKKNSKKR
ncbi:MAG: hypothetical protein ACI4LC_04470 [Emergencia sp.]